MHCLPFETWWLRVWPLLPLRGRPRFLCGSTPTVNHALVGGGEGPSLSLLLFSTGFSRALISVASRAIAPMMRPPSARSISAACILSGRSPCANSAKARENVASEGTCALRSQPRIRRNDLADTRSAGDAALRAFELATTNFERASALASLGKAQIRLGEGKAARPTLERAARLMKIRTARTRTSARPLCFTDATSRTKRHG